MGKSKQRTITTIIFMTVIAVIVISFYFYWSNKMASNKQATVEDVSEVEKLLNEDLQQNYPESSKEVVTLYADMLKVLHSGISDDQVKELALKMRELFDTDLLKQNPENDYLQSLFTEVASSKAKGRKITNFLIVNEDTELQKVVNGSEYETIYVSYTIMEKSKFSELWRYLLREDGSGHWKILGWEYAPENGK